ncbi:MAG: hypothetical protein WDA59_08855 [Methanofastidiosum sp.]
MNALFKLLTLAEGIRDLKKYCEGTRKNLTPEMCSSPCLISIEARLQKLLDQVFLDSKNVF